jgi:hypothetical protein
MSVEDSLRANTFSGILWSATVPIEQMTKMLSARLGRPSREILDGLMTALVDALNDDFSSAFRSLDLGEGVSRTEYLRGLFPRGADALLGVVGAAFEPDEQAVLERYLRFLLEAQGAFRRCEATLFDSLFNPGGLWRDFERPRPSALSGLRVEVNPALQCVRDVPDEFGSWLLDPAGVARLTTGGGTCVWFATLTPLHFVEIGVLDAHDVAVVDAVVTVPDKAGMLGSDLVEQLVSRGGGDRGEVAERVCDLVGSGVLLAPAAEPPSRAAGRRSGDRP